MNILRTVLLFTLFATLIGWHVDTADGSIKRTAIQSLDLPTEIMVTRSSQINYWHFEQPVIDEDLYCLALNIYFEGRGEPIEGQYAIAEVVLDRLMHEEYPNTICNVIKDGKYYKWNPKIIIRHKCQFSFYCDGKPDTPVDGKAFKIAQYIARDVLTNPRYVREFDHVLYYHADYVSPNWASNKLYVGRIGAHLFYTD